jgi:CubicO group peptidase (beta-lactamase class C family)
MLMAFLESDFLYINTERRCDVMPERRPARGFGFVMAVLPLFLSALISCSGNSSHLLPALVSADSIIQAVVAEEHIPGAVVLIAQHGKTIYQKAYGSAQRYDYGLQRMDALLPMTTEHRFDLASLTKVFATTFGIMFLVDQQKVDLDAPLFTYLPAFRGPGKDSVTVRHLLTHSAGLYPWKPLYYHADTAQDTYAYISRLSLLHPVGKERHYSDLGFMLLGYLIEEVSGQPLDMFLRNALYKPVGLKMTAFNPPPGGPGFAATSHGNPYEYHMVADDDFGYLCDENPETFTSWRDYVLAGEVNDGNAYYAHDGLAGHAGLFSTASDLQLLLDLLLNKGTHAGQRLLSEAVVETFLTKDRFGHGLGWAMSTDVIPVDDLPDGSFGHSGFTGTYAVAVPAYGFSIILLTNRQNVGVNASGYYNSVAPLKKSITELMIEAVQ